ncbi:MAG: SDR family oxidoreductase [Pirellulales bacterium]|nr:SDR family oxidoreductase [Pirellulales bacterium]
MSYLLLTGSTGLLGRYVLRHLSDADRRVAVVVRPGKLATARQRVELLMQDWEARLGRPLPRPVVLAGDLRRADLGLAPADERWIAENCGALLHSAASMVFKEQDDGEPRRTNVDGTRHVLELCRRTGIGEFHHVSTAYLCGLRTGRVLETELDLGQDLGNVYEQSKLDGEKLVRGAKWLRQTTFYRPASIVGDARDGFTTSYHGFYLPLQLAYTMAGRIPPEEMGERFFAQLGLRGDEGKNFVPVDWVAAGLVSIYLRPECHGQTYHLASPAPVTVREMQRVIQDSIRKYSKRRTATRATEQDLATCERMFHHHMQIYRSHWRDDPVFDCTFANQVLPHLPCPRMDYERMLRIAGYAIEQNFAAPKHRQLSLAFDAEQWLSQTAPCGGAGEMLVNLRVSGPGGGEWTLALADEGAVGWTAGLCEAAPATAYCHAQTLARLARAETSWSAALASGQLLTECERPEGGQALAALESWFDTQVGAEAT